MDALYAAVDYSPFIAAIDDRLTSGPVSPGRVAPTRAMNTGRPEQRSRAMVFEVIREQAPAVTADREPQATPTASATLPARAARRALPDGVLAQLLRSAVALQAEGLLRTVGALSGAWGGVLDRAEWVERDARDLSALTAAAVAAGARLPAGVDSGAGDPDHPSSVVEGLLAGNEALVRVLRELDDAAGPTEVEDADADLTIDDSWRGVVRGILGRREEEMVLLRAVGAHGRLPMDEGYVHGVPPRC
jgi:hypothetical protein